MEPCHFYPKFEANQVLTAKQLNEVVSYLKQQERLIRQKLTGIGPVCGLEVTYAAGAAPTLTIDKGCGITSQGDLIDIETCPLTRFRSYQDPVRYPLFWDDDTQIDLWELIRTEDAEADDGNQPLTTAFLMDKAVLLYLECREVDLETCTGEDCDEQGIRVEACVKKLLIKQSDLSAIIKTTHGLSSGVRLTDIFNAKYNLPVIRIHRAAGLLEIGDPLTYQKLHDYYLQLIKPFLIILSEAYEESYQVYAPFLAEEFKSNPFNSRQLLELFELIIKNNVQHIQYVYDYLKDLALAYEEFTGTAFNLVAACGPDAALFPKHLMLGPAIAPDTCEPSVYRQRFIPSPFHNGQDSRLEKVRLLFSRMNLLIQYFQIPPYAKQNIRITPSQEKEYPLSGRSIPYYYAIKNSLHKYWNFELQRMCKSDHNLSYHADQYAPESLPFIHGPLAFDYDGYPFFRIEGHIGGAYEDVSIELAALIQRFNLPIKVLGLRLTGEKEIKFLNGFGCRFEDLEAIYIYLRSELFCLLQKEVAFFAGLKFGRKTPTFEAGETGVAGTIRDAAGNPLPGAVVVIMDSRFNKAVAKAQSDDEGKFTLKDLTPDNYYLVINYKKLEVARDLVTIKEGQTLVIDIRFEADEKALAKSVPGTIGFESPAGVITRSADPEIKTGPQALDVTRISGGQSLSKLSTSRKSFLEESLDQPATKNTIGQFLKDARAESEIADSLDYTYKYFEKHPYLTKIDIPQAFAREIHFPVIIIEKINALAETLAEELKTFTLNPFEKRYDSLVQAAENFKKEILDDLKDPKTEPRGNEQEILRHLDYLLQDCSLEKFEALLEIYQDRQSEVQKLERLAEFAKLHPGLEHLAGVPKGGTFVIVYDNKGQVVADFSLPYICCSDCPPLSTVCVAAPIVFKLPQTTFCRDDETEYRFILSPPGGEVTGPGVRQDATTGDYYFQPAHQVVPAGRIGFEYRFDDQTARFEASIIDLQAAIEHVILSVDRQANRAKVQFTAQPEAAEAYQWDFDDGQGSTEASPEHDFDIAAQDTFNVRLTVTQGVCQSQAILALAFVDCSADFFYKVITREGNSVQVQFTASQQNLESYRWNFGDGSSSTEVSPMHAYDISETRSFSVTLDVAQADCTDQTSQTVTITTCSAAFSFSKVVEKPGLVQFVSEEKDPRATYQWDFGDGLTSNAPNPEHFFDIRALQSFTVTLRVVKADCTDQTSQTITFTTCTAAFTFTKIVEKPGLVRFVSQEKDPQARFKWDFGDGQGSEAANPEHQYNIDAQPSLTVALTVTKADCTDRSSQIITFTACTAAFSFQHVAERPGLIRFFPEMDDPEATYSWDFGDGNGSEKPNPEHVYNIEGRQAFTVTLKVAKGDCVDQTAQTVTFITCTAEFTFQQVISQRGVVQFFSKMDDPQAKYHWDFGDEQTSTEPNPRHRFNLATGRKFGVVLTVVKGDCKDVQKATITF